MAITLNSFPNGAVGFIDWLDVPICSPCEHRSDSVRSEKIPYCDSGCHNDRNCHPPWKCRTSSRLRNGSGDGRNQKASSPRANRTANNAKNRSDHTVMTPDQKRFLPSRANNMKIGNIDRV